MTFQNKSTESIIGPLLLFKPMWMNMDVWLTHKAHVWILIITCGWTIAFAGNRMAVLQSGSKIFRLSALITSLKHTEARHQWEPLPFHTETPWDKDAITGAVSTCKDDDATWCKAMSFYAAQTFHTVQRLTVSVPFSMTCCILHFNYSVHLSDPIITFWICLQSCSVQKHLADLHKKILTI